MSEAVELPGQPAGNRGEKPVGLLGGNFDPVHHGHLRVAIEAFEQLDLDHIRLLPLNQPGHRQPSSTPAPARLEMLRVAAPPHCVVDDREIARGGVTYTVDTLTEFRAVWPQRSLCVLLGADSFATLTAWHRYECLLDMAHLVVASRPDFELELNDELRALVARAAVSDVARLHESSCGHVFLLHLPRLPISSRDIRARCAAGRQIRYLVPEAVKHYICTHKLYL